MRRTRHRRLQDLFHRALEVTGDQRQAFLDDACGDDVELRLEVEELLAVDAAEAEFHLTPAATGMPETVEGTGTYRVLGELGRGGVGVVYLAERADGAFRRKVALKVLQAQTAWLPDVQRRFQSERRILAALDHPNIARLLDGGTLPDGKPFLIMELVQGETLDRHVRERQLGVEQILHLFLQVCDAVQAAHQGLVVHRDLKPSNVVVRSDGVPKLLDFGIAKLLDPAAAEWTVAETREGAQPLTPRYASPEQLAGEPITTATDVYALGVMLYELLTGRSPYRPVSGAVHHWMSAISSQQPLAPSTAVLRRATDDADVADVAADVDIDVDAEAKDAEAPDRARRLLGRRLAGDLDHIVLKALRKEPKLRYATAAELAADVRRHLEGRPVEARRGSFVYRLGKAARRHRLALAAALLFVLLGGAFTLSLSHQVRRTAAERDKARAVTDLLVGVFDVTGPSTAAGREPLAREVLDQGLERVRSGLGDDPAVKGALLDAIGRVYNNLGRLDEAQQALEEARTLLTPLRDEAPLEVAQTLNHLAVVLLARADYEQAEALAREALELTVAEVGEDDPRSLVQLDGLQQVLALAGRHAEAVTVGRRVVALTLRRWSVRDVASALDRDIPDDELAKLATVLGSLATQERRLGNHDDAESHFEQALAIHRRILGADHYIVAFDLNNLANSYSDRGLWQQAVVTRAEALAIAEPAMGGGHPSVASIRLNQGWDLHRTGRSEEGRQAMSAARDALVAALGAEHPAVAMAKSYLGSAALALGRPEEALALQQEALDLRLAVLPPEHPDLARSWKALGDAYLALGRRGDASASYTTAVAGFEASLGSEHADTQDCRRRLAELP